MAERPLRILQVNTVNNGGGAAQVAWNLHQAYRQHGLHAWVAVGREFSGDPTVALIPNDETKSFYTQVLLKAARRLQILYGHVRAAWQFIRILRWLAEPRRQWDISWGMEDFHYPGTWQLLGLFSQVPYIVHCHNLHGSYFDLRALPWLSQQVPVVLTLHDAWLLSGHCAHSFDCERWKIGCGQCPDLTVYPAIKRDATAFNWQRKRDIYARSHLYITTPSRWLMDKVQQSILMAGAKECRVIPNGVDLSIFHPADRQAVRATLGMPQDAKVLLFTAHGIQRNIWKDYQTLRAAIAQVAERLHGQDVFLIALGEDLPAERIGRAEVRFVPYQMNPKVVARYYQAADVYVHAARADTFPNTVLEALACGTPVVATAVGGIPEQIGEGVTGFLTPIGDSDVMADRIVKLLTDDDLRRRMITQAVDMARKHFDLNQQADDYLAWYQEILNTPCDD